MSSKFASWFGFLLTGLFLTACGYSVVKVATDRPAATDLTALKTFGIARINSEAPAVEREILNLVRKDLESRGYRYVNSHPDFLIAVQFYHGAYGQYVPPVRLVLRDFTPDRSGQREQELANRGIRRSEADRMSDDVSRSVHQFEGYVEEKHYHNIQVYFVNISKDKELKILWRGEVDSHTKKNDLLMVAPRMIHELMREFPNETAGPRERKIKL